MRGRVLGVTRGRASPMRGRASASVVSVHLVCGRAFLDAVAHFFTGTSSIFSRTRVRLGLRGSISSSEVLLVLCCLRIQCKCPSAQDSRITLKQLLNATNPRLITA